MRSNHQTQPAQEASLRHTTNPDARVASLEQQLAAAMREIEGLRLQRDVAMKIATWGGRRRRDDEHVAAPGES